MTLAVYPEAQRLESGRGLIGRLSSLDGLRAISIMLVLWGHLAGTRGFHTVDLHLGDLAHLGVLVFFVISGFLITTLLTREQQANGSISLKLFYARRSIRIFPAAYTYIAVVAFLWFAGVIHLHARDLWHAVTYTVNYEPAHSWQIAHLWSLSVEEQFYLLWPFVFASLRPRKVTGVAASFIFIAILARAANRLFLIGTPYHDLQMFPMVADSLAVGCVLARMRGWLEAQTWYRRLLSPVGSLAILVLLLAINRLQDYTIAIVLGLAVMNLCIAILVHRCVYHSGDRLGRVLNWKPLTFIGVMSYSLYLWQQLFINRSSDAWINRFPENVFLTLAAALASYFLIEKPLLSLRQRLRNESAVHPAEGTSASSAALLPVEHRDRRSRSGDGPAS